MNTEMQRRVCGPLVRGLAICLFSTSGFVSAAAMPEAEPNDAIADAQQITVPAEGVTISGEIGDGSDTPNTDVDFYTFSGTQGDNPVIATIGTTQPDGNGACLGFPSVVTLYDSALNVLAENLADCGTGTEARIDNYTLEANGTYYLAVAEWRYEHFQQRFLPSWRRRLNQTARHSTLLQHLLQDIRVNHVQAEQ